MKKNPLQVAVSEIMGGEYSQDDVNELLTGLAFNAGYNTSSEMLQALANDKQPIEASRAIKRLEGNLKRNGGDGAWALHRKL